MKLSTRPLPSCFVLGFPGLAGDIASVGNAKPFNACTAYAPAFAFQSFAGGEPFAGCAGWSAVHGRNGCVKTKGPCPMCVTYAGDRLQMWLPKFFIEVTTASSESAFEMSAGGALLVSHLKTGTTYWLARAKMAPLSGTMRALSDCVSQSHMWHARVLVMPYVNTVGSFFLLPGVEGTERPTCYGGLSEFLPDEWNFYLVDGACALASGGGPYARFFDAKGVYDRNARAPALTLCDLDGVSNDPILMVLTVQAVILDILRLVRPKAGDAYNPPSLLLIEEVGVLAGESAAIVSFIRDAWKTMRKYDVTCVGVTNTVTDYADSPGPGEIWRNSTNKVILPQNITAVMDMETRIKEGRNGLVPSLSHCAVLKSLVISKGEFSDGMWLGDGAEGTFTYVPTGFDYWCAASNPIEIETITAVERELAGVSIRPLAAAIETLALLYPGGVRVNRNVRPLTQGEREAAVVFARNRHSAEAV